MPQRKPTRSKSTKDSKTRSRIRPLPTLSLKAEELMHQRLNAYELDTVRMLVNSPENRELRYRLWVGWLSQLSQAFLDHPGNQLRLSNIAVPEGSSSVSSPE